MLRKILFLLLFPVIAFGQDTLDISGQIIIDRVTITDTAFVQDTIYTEIFDTTFVSDTMFVTDTTEVTNFITVYDTVTVQDTTSFIDTTNVESLALRQVNYGYNQNFETGETSLSYQAEAHGDSVLFAYFNDGILLKKSLQIPNGGVVRDTLKDPPVDSIQVQIHGYWDKWVVPFHQIVPIGLLDTLGTSTNTAMALQDIPYLTATWTSPSSNLTDYVGYFDLSDAPQSWWDEVNTSDGTKLRVAKDDAAEGATTATELAFDVQNFDDVNQTGQLWFRWSGTLASTSPDDIRIYPAKSTATSYGATDTFGSEAVWTDATAIYHMDSTTDATGNGHTLQPQGGVTMGGVTGKIGSATDFDGTDDYLLIASDISLTNDHTVLLWSNVVENGSSSVVFSSRDGEFDITGYRFEQFDNTSLLGRTDRVGGTYHDETYSESSPFGAVAHLGFDSNSTDNNSKAYKNGSLDPTTISGAISFEIFRIGHNGSDRFEGWVDELWFIDSVLGEDHISHLYANQNDTSTFWSSITLVNTGGAAAETMSVGLGATTYGLSAASAAGAGMSTQHGISYDLTGAGAASAGMSTSHPISYDLTEGSQASGASSVQLPVSYDLSSASAVTAAMNIQAAITYGMSVSMIEKIKMSVGLGSYTLDLTASGNASAVMQVSQDIAYDLSTQMSAQAVMGVSQAISYSLSAAGAAAASMDASMGYSIDMSVTSQTITTKVTLSDGRTFTISAEVRTFTPSSEGRTFTIKSENRTLDIDP